MTTTPPDRPVELHDHRDRLPIACGQRKRSLHTAGGLAFPDFVKGISAVRAVEDLHGWAIPAWIGSMSKEVETLIVLRQRNCLDPLVPASCTIGIQDGELGIDDGDPIGEPFSQLTDCLDACG